VRNRRGPATVTEEDRFDLPLVSRSGKAETIRSFYQKSSCSSGARKPAENGVRLACGEQGEGESSARISATFL